ncbi:MAG: hypothetical protein U0L67_03190 [Paludibacteraceae bacterium]|nr:hypothetical protein [Paludibacteraceae bacterium]
MKKIVCIYPEDETTAFLQPLYVHICDTISAVGIHNDTTDEDGSLDNIYDEIKDAECVIFLGHGTSSILYGSRYDNVVFESNNHNLLDGKRLLLLSCNSNQFIKKYEKNDSIGFGFLPTSLDDVRLTRTLHNVNIENIEKIDVDAYNMALVQSLINTISLNTMFDFHLFKERLKFNISREIVSCLIKRDVPNYRIVADMLYYVYKDMIIK